MPLKNTRPLSPFHRNFERHVRWVRRSLLLLVSVITVVPVSTYAFLEVEHLKADMARYGRDFALEIEIWNVDQGDVPSELQNQLEDKRAIDERIASICIMAADRTELVCTRSLREVTLPVTVDHALGSSLSPWDRVEVSSTWLVLLPGITRVFTIHLVVATVLGLLIHWLPLRALSRAHRELEATELQLLHSEKLNALGEIYAGIAHEINNPLGIILSRVQLLRDTVDEPRSPANLGRELDVLHRHTKRIGEITRGLLTFARKTEFQVSETDLNALILEVVQFVGKPFSKQGIIIDTVLGRKLPALMASRDHLQQVLLNLLNNSRDAMPDGGKIDIRTYRAEGLLVVEVADNGTGIAEDTRDNVFEPFFTTKDKGTGLGLSVSYGIIDAHGGKLEFESEPGAGATFRIKLPREGSKS